MLSTSAFNAFLKTLEEPPSYAIFILATTEKHKVLPTILDDVIAEDETAKLKNTVYDELGKTDFYKSLYLLAFKTYEGFDNF